jgi:hypothetical protein
MISVRRISGVSCESCLILVFEQRHIFVFGFIVVCYGMSSVGAG